MTRKRTSLLATVAVAASATIALATSAVAGGYGKNCINVSAYYAPASTYTATTTTERSNTSIAAQGKMQQKPENITVGELNTTPSATTLKILTGTTFEEGGKVLVEPMTAKRSVLANVETMKQKALDAGAADMSQVSFLNYLLGTNDPAQAAMWTSGTALFALIGSNLKGLLTVAATADPRAPLSSSTDYAKKGIVAGAKQDGYYVQADSVRVATAFGITPRTQQQ